MLDTIRLTFQNVSPDALKQRKDGELWMLQSTEDGTLNRHQVIQRLNVTEDGKAYNGTLAVTYDHKQRFLNIGVSSLPALLHGTSFEVLNKKDMQRVGEELSSRVQPFVDIDMNDGVFTRLDNSLLYTMDKQPQVYIALLDEMTRDAQFRMKKTYHQNETLQFRNRQRTIGFYDKYQKNRHNAVEMRFLQACDVDQKKNALRYEIQNKHAKTVRHLFGRDIALKDIHEDFFAERLHRQRVEMFDKHFRFVIGERKATLEDFLNTSIFMKTRHRRSALDKALWYIAIEKDFITLEEVRKIMKLSGFSRSAIHRRMKDFEALTSHDIQKTELYGELKTKIQETFAA
jgi:hypothetical protein